MTGYRVAEKVFPNDRPVKLIGCYIAVNQTSGKFYDSFDKEFHAHPRRHLSFDQMNALGVIYDGCIGKLLNSN